MEISIGKSIRLSDFIDSSDSHSLLLNITIASCLGATPGLEDISEVLKELNNYFDGIIINPGQAEHHANLLGGKDRAVPLVRVDWTNAYRDKNFCLPPSNLKWLMISDTMDALELGASAVVASLLLGFEDDFEANNIKALSHLARECHPLSMPIIIDICPIGKKVTYSNYNDSIKLGVSFMQELGADVLLIPDCDEETRKMICNWISVPVLMKTDTIYSQKKLNTLFQAGLAGIVLSEKIFNVKNLSEKIRELESIIHE